ncbi:MAG: bifunctional diaminohydroxyphosphoribosylaminopyrimidine deaminase/5-amino-6-(5-phosphoribosylamino)uracil reductase RibD [Dokdonella sp.]|uniref:bifunctional diaminohydroxyphosphoribosylaminopyrimidine deaminase/5-amino-6-(5-phosphoribosylamino)uracil reductase RibD n=1 Tax=Dokdonella sp. TaxID=2291710 RepID=UPI00326710E1
MARALRLAERGLCTTQPNPRVGCVIVRDDEVVGTGWHERAGGAHAEVVALTEAGERAAGATAYVTLEPCGLRGRTPPCADALIAAGVARVVIASQDAFQREGGALDRLRAAGIVVDAGLMRDAARALNRGFFSRVERGRPWVRVKLAMSLDGRTGLANGESKWITGEAARADVQRWRARSSAIVTGIGTVLADDPRLTVRRVAGEKTGESLGSGASEEAVPPLRVIFDRSLRTPRRSHVLDGSTPTLVLHGGDATNSDGRFEQVERLAVESDSYGLDLKQALDLLGSRGMNEVQVEAGATLSGALFEAGLVDELLLYVAPVFLGDAAKSLLALPTLADMAGRWALQVVDRREVGADMRLLLRAP